MTQPSPPPAFPPPAFTGGALDRSAHVRGDADLLARLFAQPERRLVPLWRDQHPLDINNLPISIESPEGREVVFVGIIDDVPWFAVDLSDLPEPPAIAHEWHDLRWVGLNVPASEASVLATARGLLNWHRRHRFCAVCGSPTIPQDAGHKRRCVNTECNAEHFPRTDPAVIMLVTDSQGRALLGRQAKWAAGMVSTLAGFVETGETLEQTVIREVFEEAGVHVRNPRYAGSQPWPFPSSLMLAFEAEAITTEIAVDQEELEFAGWFTRDQVRAFGETVPDGSPTWTLPGRALVSRWLINRWLAAGE